MPDTNYVFLVDEPGMRYEKLPFDMWLPYKRHKSEVYSGMVYSHYRFDEAIVYWENDDDPEDDLVEELIKIPDGYVAWARKSRCSTIHPRVGDIFHVLCPTTGEVLFTETIEKIRRIADWECALAKRAVEAAPVAAVIPNMTASGQYELTPGMRFVMQGDAAEWGIDKDYDVRVDTICTIEETPKPGSKKVLVTIDNIDGDSKVCKRVWVGKCRQSIKNRLSQLKGVRKICP